MVSDEPRLPGVPVPGGGGLRRRETAYARSVDLSSSLIAAQSARPGKERSRCAIRGLEPFKPLQNPSNPFRPFGPYEDPRSGTDFLVAGWPERRLAA